MTKWTIPESTEVARLREALADAESALMRIHDLNVAWRDENGHKTVNSELIEREAFYAHHSIMAALSGPAPGEGRKCRPETFGDGFPQCATCGTRWREDGPDECPLAAPGEGE